MDGGGLRSTPLHKAAQKGDEREVLALLAEGADPRAKDTEGRTALHHAVMRGYLRVVEELLEQGGPGLLLQKDILGCTPVHLAAVQNQVTLIMKLVGALLQDTRSCTPLHQVAPRRCMQDFMGFLHLGWDIATKGEVAGGPVIEGDPAWQEVAGVIDLAQPGLPAVYSTMGWAPLHVAAMEGPVALIDSLVQVHACDLLIRSANSWTPLHCAAAYNRVDAIERLVQLGCDPAVRDSVNSTPLHVAAGEGHIEAIMKLVALGCPPTLKDRDGCTPLYSAAAWNRLEAVQVLDRLGCPSHQRSGEGRTPVHVAAEQGWLELIVLLVRELHNSVDVKDSYQFTPLHSAANGGHVRTIQKLIQFNHDVDVRDYLGRTPLHYAAMHGRVAAVEELVRQGASVAQPDSRGGYTPLHLAADAGQCEVIAKLAELGADLEATSTKGWTPLSLATMKGPANVEAIGVLVELGACVGGVTEAAAMETPLHIAARAGRPDIIAKMLRCGLSPTAQTKDGSTALHYAAAFGQCHVVEALVKAGCPVDARDNAQNTPLHLAAGCGFLDTIVRLVELGADLNARDITDCTPLQNAAHGTYSALAAMPATSASGMGGGGAAVAEGRTGAVTGPQLTAVQQAAQAALTATASSQAVKHGGMVPVRTGLAWAAAGQNEVLASMGLGVEGEAGRSALSEWRGLGLMQLLKRASKRRGAAFPSAVLDAAANAPATCTGPPAASAALAPAVSEPLAAQAGSLVAAAAGANGVGGGGGKEAGEREFGLEALLKRTEALQLSAMEQDRARLIPVAARMVELGASLGARDNEGRTALHLAAGCGDKAMVLRLVHLGTDVNCRDSVGGTPMHHAAMANKKEMMFVLARLGCDWRARADGIDGATAAFVLCGQHGKTTRQQKLLEAKLKRCFQEGQAARAAGQSPVAVEEGAEAGAREEVSSAEADANMAALLEEVQQEGDIGAAKKRKKKRKGKGREGEGLGDEEAPPRLHSHVSADLSSQASDDLGEAAPAAAPPLANGHPPSPAAPSPLASQAPSSSQAAEDIAARARAMARPGDGEVAAAAERAAAAAHEGARLALEHCIARCAMVVDAGPASGEDVIQEALDTLDAAIGEAAAKGVSAKYAKKVRRRLQGLLTPDEGEGEDAAEQLHDPINLIVDQASHKAGKAGKGLDIPASARQAAAPAMLAPTRASQKVQGARAASGASASLPRAAAAARSATGGEQSHLLPHLLPVPAAQPVAIPAQQRPAAAQPPPPPARRQQPGLPPSAPVAAHLPPPPPASPGASCIPAPAWPSATAAMVQPSQLHVQPPLANGIHPDAMPPLQQQYQQHAAVQSLWGPAPPVQPQLQQHLAAQPLLPTSQPQLYHQQQQQQQQHAQEQFGAAQAPSAAFPTLSNLFQAGDPLVAGGGGLFGSSALTSSNGLNTRAQPFLPFTETLPSHLGDAESASTGPATQQRSSLQLAPPAAAQGLAVAMGRRHMSSSPASAAHTALHPNSGSLFNGTASFGESSDPLCKASPSEHSSSLFAEAPYAPPPAAHASSLFAQHSSGSPVHMQRHSLDSQHSGEGLGKAGSLLGSGSMGTGTGGVFAEREGSPLGSSSPSWSAFQQLSQAQQPAASLFSSGAAAGQAVRMGGFQQAQQQWTAPGAHAQPHLLQQEAALRLHQQQLSGGGGSLGLGLGPFVGRAASISEPQGSWGSLQQQAAPSFQQPYHGFSGDMPSHQHQQQQVFSGSVGGTMFNSQVGEASFAHQLALQQQQYLQQQHLRSSGWAQAGSGPFAGQPQNGSLQAGGGASAYGAGGLGEEGLLGNDLLGQLGGNSPVAPAGPAFQPQAAGASVAVPPPGYTIF